MKKILAVKNALERSHHRRAFVQNVPCGNTIIEVDTYSHENVYEVCIYKNGGISYVNGSTQKVLFKNEAEFLEFLKNEIR